MWKRDFSAMIHKIVITLLLVAAFVIVGLGPLLTNALGFPGWCLAIPLLVYPLIELVLWDRNISSPLPPWMRVRCENCAHYFAENDFADRTDSVLCPACDVAGVPVLSFVCRRCDSYLPIGPGNALLGGIRVPSVCPNCALEAKDQKISFDYLNWTPGRCSKCSYNLTGNESGVCPECGAELIKR